MNITFKSVFGNPWVGVIGSLASIVGLGLAVYFYAASIRTPDFTYYVSPSKTSIVKAGVTSGLTFLFDGKNLDKDVSAMQIAFWNAGKLPIRREDILSPITISLGANARILECSVVKVSRDSTGVNLANIDQTGGHAKLDWRILEANDGGVLQIIYTGDTSVEATFSGEIVGQNKLRRQPTDGVLSPEFRTMFRVGGVILWFMAALLFFLRTRIRIRTRIDQRETRASRKRRIVKLVFEICFYLFYFAFGLYLISRSIKPYVPFNL